MSASRALVLRLVAIGLAAGAPALARAAGGPGGEPARHHFGDVSRPEVALVFEEPETPGAPCFLELELLAANRIETRAATPAPTRTSCRRTDAGWEVSGTSRLEGRELAFRASVRPDGSALEWTSPRSVTLRDGSVHALAGRYARLGEPGRAAAAREAFEAADRELNAVYRRLVGARPPEAVAALRADQRRWLKYRDFTLFDGDDAASVGPGAATHLRQQGLRTLERVRYLGALLDPPRTALGETLYSDGRSGTIAVRRLGDALTFSVRVGVPGFDRPNVPRDVPLRLGGVARPSGPLVWEALPAQAFDDTTDGLEGAERQALLTTGSGGSFTIKAESPDQLFLRFPGGHVRVALFAGTDGGAVLAARGRGVLHLDDSGTIRRTRPGSGGGAASEGTQVLVWDGYGFVAERGDATSRPGE